MKKILNLFLVFGIAFVLTGCGSSSDDSAKDDKKVEEAETLTDEEINTQLAEISNWVIGDYWNEGLINLSNYAMHGTDAIGSDMDVDATLKNYNEFLKTASKYDKFINSLDKEKYEAVIESWNKMYEEMKTLDTFIQKGVEANSDPEWDTDLFVQYRNDFSKEVSKITNVDDEEEMMGY